MSLLFWTFLLILFGAAGAAGFWGYRMYVAGENSFNMKGMFFRPRREPRLSVSEQAAVDSRRRLILIRRDNVEHLIMTGGPVDVVIETGIEAHAKTAENAPLRAPAAPKEIAPPVFTRPPRSLGQAVNE